MIRHYLALLLFCSCFATLTRAQDLVANGSFEQFNNCPPFPGFRWDHLPSYSTFPTAKDWVGSLFNLEPTYLNQCSTVPDFSAPRNSSGYQQPHSGAAYVSMEGYVEYTSVVGNIRHALTTKLNRPMSSGTEYFVRFFVSPTISTTPPNGRIIPRGTLNEIGAHISLSPPTSQITDYNLNIRYDIVNDTNRRLNDTSRWYEIGGIYKSFGNERWLTIGSFARSRYPSTDPPCSGPGDFIAQFYLDDVSVVPVKHVLHTMVSCDSSQATLTLNSSLPYGAFSWNTGDTTASLVIDTPGKYVCRAYNDSIYIVDSFTVISKNYISRWQLKACDSPGLPITLSSSLNASRYIWSTGAKVRSITPPQPGVYVSTATNPCARYIDEFTVTADSVSALHAAPAYDTTPVDRMLTASTASSPFYRWNTGETSSSIRADRLGYYFCYSFNGCEIVTDSFIVFYHKPAKPRAIDTTICQYVPSPRISVGDSNVVWFLQPSGGAELDRQPVINTGERGRSLLYVARQEYGCLSDRVPVSITIMSTPKPLSTDTLMRCDDIVNYAEPIGSPYVDDVFYKWSSGEEKSYIVPPDTGQYVRRSYNDCADVSDTFRVIRQNCLRCAEFPNVFSPNGDGRNDAFGPVLICPVERYSFSIYNRWGQRVFETADQSAQWNGLLHGAPAPAGTYMYMASMYHKQTGRRYFKEGDVILLR